MGVIIPILWGMIWYGCVCVWKWGIPPTWPFSGEHEMIIHWLVGDKPFWDEAMGSITNLRWDYEPFGDKKQQFLDLTIRRGGSSSTKIMGFVNGCQMVIFSVTNCHLNPEAERIPPVQVAGNIRWFGISVFKSDIGSTESVIYIRFAISVWFWLCTSFGLKGLSFQCICFDMRCYLWPDLTLSTCI